MIDTRQLRAFLDDLRLKPRIKVENYLLVHLGLRPCSQMTMPVELPGSEAMGSTIDRMIYPKMSRIRNAKPHRRQAAIDAMKEEMRAAYERVVEGSEQYRAHMDWASELGLLSRVVEVRPTVRELYLYKDRGVGERISGLMRERERLRAEAHARMPDLTRAELAYPEEFDGLWLRQMGEALGYPGCCVDAYAFDRVGGMNVEERAARQIMQVKPSDAIDPFAYFVGYFFPCTPDCREALSRGKECRRRLSEVDPATGDLYATLAAENLERVRRQPEVMARHRARAEARAGLFA